MNLPPLTPAELAEKLAPPRPLVTLGDGLYGPPRPGSQRAWAAWVWVAPERRRRGHGTATVKAMIDAATADGARSLTLGGPPGNYVESGLDADDAALRRWASKMGFVEDGAHVDLIVTTRRARREERVSRCAPAEVEAVRGWIARTFSEAWAMEAERAASHEGLFIARTSGEPVGFAAHSGNLAARGTFGPIGVSSASRGGGLGRALAETVLDDLRARGFDRVVVPWVAPDTARFYATFCEVTERRPRVTMRLMLNEARPRTGSV